MKLSVVSDHQGKILSVFPAPSETQAARPQSEGQKTGKLTYMPKSGEHLHVLEVPSSFHGRELLDIHTKLRVEKHGDAAKLVEVKAD
jgi:hypothetical protein